MDLESGFEPSFDWQPELDELLEQLLRRNRSIAGWTKTPAEIFRKIDDVGERGTLFDSLFDEPAHLVERLLARPHCPLEDAFSETYKRIWIDGMFDYKPGSRQRTDDLGRFATSAPKRFLAYVAENIPPYWSREQYLLIHDMEVRPHQQVQD